MPVGLSPVSVSRIAAGVLAAAWAITGLSNNYATFAAVGPSAPTIAAIAANVLLTAGASLAFVNAQGWRNVLLIVLTIATIDRIFNAVGTGGAVQESFGAVVAFIAIAAVALTPTFAAKR